MDEDAYQPDGGSGGDATFTDDLFAAVVERGRVREATCDRAWVAAMCRAESELAAAQADLGVIPAAAAAEIAEVAVEPDRLDLARITRDTALGANPVIPLVTALRSRLSESAAQALHHGATSQDILDTAAMLLARTAIAAIRDDLADATSRLATLARDHDETPMAGRTLMQHAIPITFGHKVRTWAYGIEGADDRLARTSASLPAQLGGPVGTRTSFGDEAETLAEAYAARLELAASPCWHTVRLPIADLAAALAATDGVVDKVAGDVVLMAQQEVCEVREASPGRGGSSSMAHKNNPVAAISARASARRAPALAGHLFGSMAHEHERAAGAWHAEWIALVDLLRCTGSAAAWLADCLGHLEIDPEAMRRNV